MRTNIFSRIVSRYIWADVLIPTDTTTQSIVVFKMGTETIEPVTYHNIDVDHTILLIGPLNIQNNDVLLIVQLIELRTKFFASTASKTYSYWQYQQKSLAKIGKRGTINIRVLRNFTYIHESDTKNTQDLFGLNLSITRGV